MSKKQNNIKDESKQDKLNPSNNAVKETEANSTHMALDDARRVKVLSPSMLVFKRFIRNKLAITGSIILVFMFLLSFLGGAISPFKEGETFDAQDTRDMPYAYGTKVKGVNYVSIDPDDLISGNPEIINTISQELEYSTGAASDGKYIYKVQYFDNDFTTIYRMTDVVTVMMLSDPQEYITTPYAEEISLVADDGFKAAYEGATESISVLVNKKEKEAKLFTYNEVEYMVISQNKTETVIYAPKLIGMSTGFEYDANSSESTAIVDSFDFKYAFEDARYKELESFTVDGVEYRITNQPLPIVVQEIRDVEDPNYDADFDNTITKNGFKQAVIDSIENEVETFTINGVEYTLRFVEYELTAYGKDQATIDAANKIVKNPEFEEFVHNFVVEKESELMDKKPGGGYTSQKFANIPYIGVTTRNEQSGFAYYTDADDDTKTYPVSSVDELIAEEGDESRLYFEDANGKHYVRTQLSNYEIVYDSGNDQFIVKKESGASYAKFKFLNTHDVVYKNDAGEEVIYAEAFKWDASNVQRVEEDGTLTDFANISNFKVSPQTVRGGGVELDLEFKNIVREKCAAIPTSSQPMGVFVYNTWVRDIIEPRTRKGEDDELLYTEDKNNGAISFPVSETGIVKLVNADGVEVFVVAVEAEDGSVEVVEIRYTTKYSAVTATDPYGEYYIDAETGAPIHLAWPILRDADNGQYYVDENGNSVSLQSVEATIAVKETDQAGATFYIDAADDSIKYPISGITLVEQVEDDGTVSLYFETEDGVKNFVKTTKEYSAVTESDAEGTYYLTLDGEKVYKKTITAVSNENSGAEEVVFTATDAYGVEHKIQFTSQIDPEKTTVDGVEHLTENVADNPRTFAVADIGVHVLRGNDDSAVTDDRLYVYRIIDSDGEATASKIFIEPSIGFEIALEGEEGAYARDVEFHVEYGNPSYIIRTETLITVYDVYSSPSSTHWLGTDAHGMDTLTRIMYGGRISLMVGFVVIFIEMFIGVIVGGFSGYFGGVVDTILMRFVDLFNCIPYWPMMLIGGSLMDAYDIGGTLRIFVLMAIMGVLGWTGVARIVRGQILSLREQDFMVATEATGIKISRRIFKHLVPNVMPLLIVQATMGLGGIIISEATLSYLGLGVQYPQASWGSILNSIKTAYEMTNYWYIWVPAGLCIMLTVLGFNFVGDGLRDAFDPKMKR